MAGLHLIRFADLSRKVLAVNRVVPQVSDVGALRSIQTSGLSEDAVRCVMSGSNRGLFSWVSDDAESDDGANAIKPDDVVSSSPGRWRKTSLRVGA